MWRSLRIQSRLAMTRGSRGAVWLLSPTPARRSGASSSFCTLATGNGTVASSTQLSRIEELLQHSRLTHVAQDLWAQVLRPGDVAVDATAGNGHDTLSLARAVGSTGTVWAFDVQEAAIAATRGLLESQLPAEAMSRVHCIRGSHADMLEAVGASAARLVCFNLGFLPGSDKSIATRQDSTLQAVAAACDVLQPGGLLSIMAYTGHPGGREEYEAVREQLAGLSPASWHTGGAGAECRELAPDIASTAVAKAVAEAERHEAAAQRTADAFAVFLAAAFAASADAAAAPAPVSMPRPACSSQCQEAAVAVNVWRCGSAQRSSAFDSLQARLVLLRLHH